MKQEKIKVLYVDDEVNNLLSFRANFRKFFEVYTAKSAGEGLRILKSKKIQVIITDQRMPDVTGVEFLESIVLNYPNTIRIFLTGYDDVNVAANAINKGQIFRYITKPWNEQTLKKTIEDAYELYASREQKNRETDTFVYKVSHDLKGPLASIGGLVNIAREETEDHNSKKYINLIGNRVEHLDGLLNELLDFITIEPKQSNYSAINFKALVQEIIVSLENIENFSTIDFQINIFQKTDFYCDKGILRSIIQNLILNAIKFKRSDILNPHVSIDIISSEKEATIEIEDNGLGMSETVISKIFKLFYRANENIKGSGLGLYIVKTGVEKVKGKIKVQSIPSEGTVFTIRIPNNGKPAVIKKKKVSGKKV